MQRVGTTLIMLMLVLCISVKAYSGSRRKSKAKDGKATKISLNQPDGSSLELPEEIGPCKCVDQPFSARLVTVGAASVRVSLPNGKAAVRVHEGMPITLFATFPENSKPNLELFHFEVVGSQRVTYTEGCPRSDGAHLNVIPLRISHAPDGRWMLQPIRALPKGEYCLSHATSHKWYTDTSDPNYCFGVDSR